MNRRFLTLIITLATFLFVVTPAHAGTFFEDFNDGNTDGWELGYTLGPVANIGNWRVDSGMLLQDSGFDGVLALLSGFQIGTQVTHTQLKLNGPSGGAGIVVWAQDTTTLAYVLLSGGTITVAEVEEGTWHSTNYPFAITYDNNWINLKVEANNLTGMLDVYIDNDYVLTHLLTTTHRVGQTGLIHGNAGGYFDDFSITSGDIILSRADLLMSRGVPGIGLDSAFGLQKLLR